MQNGASVTPALFSAHVAIILFGLIAGFFYAFSVCVMSGLDLVDPVEAIHAMQAINLSVRNPVFFVTFFLTPVAGFIVTLLMFRAGMARAAAWMLAATLVYLFGAFIPTALINVPMNEALGLVDPAAAGYDAASAWEEYSARWTAWNTARTIASTLALLLAVAGLTQAARAI